MGNQAKGRRIVNEERISSGSYPIIRKTIEDSSGSITEVYTVDQPDFDNFKPDDDLRYQLAQKDQKLDSHYRYLQWAAAIGFLLVCLFFADKW